MPNTYDGQSPLHTALRHLREHVKNGHVRMTDDTPGTPHEGRGVLFGSEEAHERMRQSMSAQLDRGPDPRVQQVMRHPEPRAE